jgi:hypothetical protein
VPCHEAKSTFTALSHQCCKQHSIFGQGICYSLTQPPISVISIMIYMKWVIVYEWRREWHGSLYIICCTMGYTLCGLIAHYHTSRMVKDPNESNRSKAFQINFFFLWHCNQTQVTASSFLRLLDHTQWCTTASRSPMYKWSAHCRDCYLTTHHSQETNNHVPSGIQTHKPNKRAAAYPCRRLCGHWEWIVKSYSPLYQTSMVVMNGING